MKSSLAVVIVSGALIALIAGASSAFAQANLAPPTIVRPVWNGPPQFHSAWVGDFTQVVIRPVANVSRFQLILFRDGAGIAYSTRIFSQSEGATEGTGTNRTIRFTVQIPSSEQGFINRLVVKSCNNNNQCGNAASSERFIVLPTAPALFGPAHPTTVAANRVVTFSWQHNTLNLQLGGGQTSFPGDYQLTLITREPEDIGYPWVNPDAIQYPSISARLGTGSTCPVVPGQSNLNRRCHTMTLPPGVTAYKWTIANCAIFPEKGRRCGPSAFRSLAAPQPFAVSFSANLAPTLRHARCVNCHAVRMDNYQQDSPSNPAGGLPSNHPHPENNPNFTWTAARESSGQCAICHTDNLLSSEGNINPGWHTPASTRDFRNKTNADLCQLARTFAPPATSAQEHLSEDKLILWAVGDGRVPDGTRRLTAPPHSIQGWKLIVAVWENAGRPCN
ncbi:MAG: hypothetical protein HOP35_04915 [Nitrospira sp.]|nr:hypothetical protein [Nitrospira sp.]